MAVPIASGIPVVPSNGVLLYPSYQLVFTVGGNEYIMSATLLSVSGAWPDSTDLDAAMTTMAGSLGEGYTGVTLNQFSITETALTV